MDARRTNEPVTRLTEVANRMVETWDADPDTKPRDRGIIMLMNGRDGGVAFFGYDDPDNDTAAIADLIVHLRNIMIANGKHVEIVFLK
jgi:hypothetical protein